MSSYSSILRRRYPTILLMIPALAWMIFFVLNSGGRTYESRAVVQTGSAVASAVIGQSVPYEEPERRLATELEFFGSDVVTARAVATLEEAGWTGPTADLDERVSVAPRGVSNLLDVVGTDRDAQRAQQLTSAFTAAYIEYRQQFQRELLTGVLEDLEAQLAVAEEEVASFDSGELSGAEARSRAAAVARYDSVAELVRNARLRLSVDTSGVALLSPASPGEPVQSLGLPLSVLLSLLAATLLAIGIVVLLDLLRDPVRTPGEATSTFNLPVLAEVPRPRGPAWTSLLDDPTSRLSSSGRSLRLQLTSSSESAARTILVTGSEQDADDVLLVAASMATAWRRTGARVAVVTDAIGPLAWDDPRSGPEVGVAGEGAAVASVQVLPATGSVGRTAGVLDSTSPSSALQDVLQHVDVVIISLPSTDAVGAGVVARLVDVTVVVCALGRTPAGRLGELLRHLTDHEADLRGLVLTRGVGRRGRAEGTAAATSRRARQQPRTGASRDLQGAGTEGSRVSP